MIPREDRNEALVIGKVLNTKVFEPNQWGKAGAYVTLRVGAADLKLKLDLSVNEKFDERKTFAHVYKQGAFVCVANARFESYVPKPKEGKPQEGEVFQVAGKMIGSYNVDGEAPLTNALVTGRVEKPCGEWALVLAKYDGSSPKDRQSGAGPTWKDRRVRIQLTGASLERLAGKHVTVLGEIAQNRHGPFLTAKAIAVADAA